MRLCRAPLTSLTWRAWARASAPRMRPSTQLSPSIAHLSTRQPQNSTFSKSLLAESVFQRNISTSLKSDRVSKCLGRSLHLINHRASFYLCAEGLLTDKKIIKKNFLKIILLIECAFFAHLTQTQSCMQADTHTHFT